MTDVVEIILLAQVKEIILLTRRVEIFPHITLEETEITLLMIGMIGTLLHLIGKIGIMAISPEVIIIVTEEIQIMWIMVPRAAKDFIMAHVIKDVGWEMALGSQITVNVNPILI